MASTAIVSSLLPTQEYFASPGVIAKVFLKNIMRVLYEMKISNEDAYYSFEKSISLPANIDPKFFMLIFLFTDDICDLLQPIDKNHIGYQNLFNEKNYLALSNQIVTHKSRTYENCYQHMLWLCSIFKYISENTPQKKIEEIIKNHTEDLHKFIQYYFTNIFDENKDEFTLNNKSEQTNIISEYNAKVIKFEWLILALNLNKDSYNGVLDETIINHHSVAQYTDNIIKAVMEKFIFIIHMPLGDFLDNLSHFRVSDRYNRFQNEIVKNICSPRLLALFLPGCYTQVIKAVEEILNLLNWPIEDFNDFNLSYSSLRTFQKHNATTLYYGLNKTRNLSSDVNNAKADQNKKMLGALGWEVMYYIANENYAQFNNERDFYSFILDLYKSISKLFSNTECSCSSNAEEHLSLLKYDLLNPKENEHAFGDENLNTNPIMIYKSGKVLLFVLHELTKLKNKSNNSFRNQHWGHSSKVIFRDTSYLQFVPMLLDDQEIAKNLILANIIPTEQSFLKLYTDIYEKRLTGTTKFVTFVSLISNNIRGLFSNQFKVVEGDIVEQINLKNSFKIYNEFGGAFSFCLFAVLQFIYSANVSITPDITTNVINFVAAGIKQQEVDNLKMTSSFFKQFYYLYKHNRSDTKYAMYLINVMNVWIFEMTSSNLTLIDLLFSNEFE